MNVSCPWCKNPVSRDFELINVEEPELEKYLKKLEQVIDYLEDRTTNIKSHIQYIEHTSANPTSEPHQGNIFNGIIGDILCRLTGCEANYYVNDLGSNFSKVLAKWQKTRPTDDKEKIGLYAKPDLISDQEIDNTRRRIFSQGLTKEDEYIRDYYLNLICKTMKLYNVNFHKYIYQSSYRDASVKLYNTLKDKKVNCQIRCFTDTGLPLYILQDYFYHQDVAKKITPTSVAVLVVGQDHKAYVKQLKTLFAQIPNSNTTLNNFNYVFYPVVKDKQGNKLSKRKETSSNPIVPYCANRLRLYLLKYFGRDVVYKQDLDTELMSRQFTQMLTFNSKIPEYTEIKKLLRELSEEELKSCKIYSQLEQMIHVIISKGKIHRIYKLLEFLKYKSPNKSIALKKINSYFYFQFCKKLGLRIE